MKVEYGDARVILENMLIPSQYFTIDHPQCFFITQTPIHLFDKRVYSTILALSIIRTTSSSLGVSEYFLA